MSYLQTQILKWSCRQSFGLPSADLCDYALTIKLKGIAASFSLEVWNFCSLPCFGESICTNAVDVVTMTKALRCSKSPLPTLLLQLLFPSARANQYVQVDIKRMWQHANAAKDSRFTLNYCLTLHTSATWQHRRSYTVSVDSRRAPKMCVTTSLSD